MSDDLVLIQNVKQGCEVSLYCLYEKHIGFMKDYFRKIKLSGSFKKSIYADYMQDCFLHVKECCMKFDIEKSIKDNTGFLSYYHFYLKKISLKLYKHNIRFSKIDFDIVTENIKADDWIYKCDQNIDNENLKRFSTKVLSDRELSVLDMREKGMTINEIAVKTNRSYGMIHRDIKFAENKLNQNGFYIKLVNSCI